MHLALGSIVHFGTDWSIHVKEDSKAPDIANALRTTTISTGCCGGGPSGLWPNQIIMIKNGPDGPEVFTRYLEGLHYPKEGQEEVFRVWENQHVSSS